MYKNYQQCLAFQMNNVDEIIGVAINLIGLSIVVPSIFTINYD